MKNVQLVARLQTWQPQPQFTLVQFNDGNEFLIDSADRKFESDLMQSHGVLVIDQDVLNCK